MYYTNRDRDCKVVRINYCIDISNVEQVSVGKLPESGLKSKYSFILSLIKIAPTSTIQNNLSRVFRIANFREKSEQTTLKSQMRQCAISKCRLCKITNVIAPLSGTTLHVGTRHNIQNIYEQQRNEREK